MIKINAFEMYMEISSTKILSNWLRKWAMAMWKVANEKFQFSCLQTGTVNHKSYSSMKLTRNNPFRLYLIEKNN